MGGFREGSVRDFQEFSGRSVEFFAGFGSVQRFSMVHPKMISKSTRVCSPYLKVYRGVLPMVRNRHCELQSHELEDLEALSLEAAKRYLKRIKWYLNDSYRLWFQSCLQEVTNQNAVVIIDVSDSSKSWIYEAISAIRSLSSHSTGRLNFIQFNGRNDLLDLSL